MRILLNDFSGHPFQVQLSRELAKRGHVVLHTWCASFVTPHGGLVRRADDPASFDLRAVKLDAEFNKTGLLSRWGHEREVGRRVVAVAQDFQPDVILSANMPLGAQGLLLKYARKHQVPFVFWIQDLYGEGAKRVLRKRIPIIGGSLGRVFSRYERRLLARSSHVVAVSEDFLPYLAKGTPRKRISVIENWAPIKDLPVLSKSNDWSREHDLADKMCLLYAGTLGLKHNPELLLALAREFGDRRDIRVVVISEGAGADYLAAQKSTLGLRNLFVMGFQPFELMPQVLASADVLVTILEKDAGVFAVPSKVLTYLCAKRSLLLAVPSANLAARIVSQCGAGLVAGPDNVDAFVTAAQRLVENEQLRESLAKNGRAYAERTFDIVRIVDRFEEIIQKVSVNKVGKQA